MIVEGIKVNKWQGPRKGTVVDTWQIRGKVAGVDT